MISFSNAQYYEDRLSSFPAFPGQLFDTGVSFTRVPGTFQRSGRRGTEKGLLRTNPVEATAVVEEVLRRWRQRERSIGVVTFNIQQRALIEKMLWDSEVDGVREALAQKDDGLFVKNLENVQGDERDVIIFSTGFSVDARGVLPLNFGPLNRSGGERRLNVAVTRARRRVMVFSSFEPEDLRTEQTSSVGIKHLRTYLEQARVRGGATGPERGCRSTAMPSSSPRLCGRGVRRCRPRSGCRNSGSTSPWRRRGAARLPTLAVLLDGPAWAARVDHRRPGWCAGQRARRDHGLARRRPGLAAGLAHRPRRRRPRPGGPGATPRRRRRGRSARASSSTTWTTYEPA